MTVILQRPKIKTWQPHFPYIYAHLKRDGQLLWMSRNTSTMERCSLMTRIGTDITVQLVGHEIVREFVARAPADTILLCELFAPGHQQSQVKSFLASGDLDSLYIECFAVPNWSELTPLESCESFCRDIGVPFTPFLNVRDTLYSTDQVEAWWRSALPDAEGLVCKDGNLLNWMRRKEKRTADLIVTGYTEGEGKFLGLIGSLECGLVDGSVTCSCSGMTDDVRRAISDDWGAHLGRVVEVSYQYVGSQGGLRHPQFVRFRDDKTAEECTGL